MTIKIKWLACIAAAFGCGLHTIAIATPYRPTSPAEVLLELGTGVQRAAIASTQSRNANSTDAVVAAKIAQEFIDLGRSQNDERYFGYASAALQAWTHNDVAPIEIAVLLADIAQHQHRFIDARKMLDDVIARDAFNPRARLMRASLLMTLGQPQLAKRDCQQLFSLKESFVATICIAQAASLTGRLAPSYDVVSALLQQATTAHSDQYGWALGVAGEMAVRKGDLPAAERWFRKAIELSPSDLVSRLQLCDVLLQRHHAQDVSTLLLGAPASEPVILRIALAAQQGDDKVAAQSALNTWQSAIEQSAQLGIRLHLRELARGELELQNNPQRALRTALENWNVQREFADARILADAARATNDKQALKLIRDWQQQLNFEDAGLAKL